MDTMSLVNNPLSLFQVFGDISCQLDVLHCAALIASLRQQQAAGQQCNFAINVQTKANALKTFNVHKCILAAVSKEIATTDTSVAGMELQASEVAVQKLIDFAYAGKIVDLQELSMESVVEIWELAGTLKAAYLRSYLLKARPHLQSQIVYDREDAGNITVVPININPSLSPVHLNKLIPAVPYKNNSKSTTGSDNSLPVTSDCIAEVCNMAVKMEHNVNETDSTFPSDYSNSEPPSPVGFPGAFGAESTANTFSHPVISKSKTTQSQKSKKKSLNVQKAKKTIPKKATNSTNNASKSSSSVDAEKEMGTAKINVKHKQVSPGARSKRQKVDDTATNETEARPAKTKLLDNYEQTDIDLLKELKALAPNASLWSVIPDLT